MPAVRSQRTRTFGRSCRQDVRAGSFSDRMPRGGDAVKERGRANRDPDKRGVDAARVAPRRDP